MQICTILKIKDESKLVSSIKIIEQAYQLLPSLQSTVENIFKIVYDGNIFDTPLNSYDVDLTLARTYQMLWKTGPLTSKTTRIWLTGCLRSSKLTSKKTRLLATS